MSTSVSTAELQRMTPKELRQEISVHRTEYAKMRMGVEMQKEKNHALYKMKRREIARMKTIENAMKKNAMNPTKPKKPTNPLKSLDSLVSSDSSEKPSLKAKKPVKVPRSK